MQNKSTRMKTNFDKLEAAGLVAGEDTTTLTKSKIQTRITDLNTLANKVSKIEAALIDLYVLSKPARLKKLTQVLGAVKKLHASTLPVGAKSHIGKCLNELVSLREGVYASQAQIDKKSLTLLAASKARLDIQSLIVIAKARLDRVMADSSNSSDLDEFYKKAEDAIERHSSEAEKLSSIRTKPFVVSRVPVVPTGALLSIDRLSLLGFDVDNLGGYVVLNKQLVIGINPKHLLGEHGGELSSAKVSKFIREEVDRLRKLLQKKTNTKLQLVADTAFTFDTGTWFWLMSNKDLDALARAFPGNHIKITRWGFAFNKPESAHSPDRNSAV